MGECPRVRRSVGGLRGEEAATPALSKDCGRGWGPGGHKDQNEPLRNQVQNEYFLALPDGPENFCQGIPQQNLCFDFFHTTCTKLSNSYTRFSTEKNESAKSLISIGFYRVCCMRTFMPLEVDISRNGRIPTF